MADTRAAITGEARAGTMILPMMDDHATPPVPMAAKAAPMRPPNRAWEEEDGRPRSQVNRFQKMPPIRPVKTTMRRFSPSVALERL